VEVTLVSKRGDFGWVAIETCHGPSSSEVLFTRPQGNVPYWDELASGTRLRLTNAHYTTREGEPPLVNATTFSEALLL
jgi:hypothetical protein